VSIGQRRARPELHHHVIVGRGGWQQVEPQVGGPARVIGLGQARRQLDRPIELGDRRPQLAILGKRQAAMVVSGGLAGIERDRTRTR